MSKTNLAVAAPALAMFVPITKVDEEKRLVYGRITAESVDRSNEILDYAASKPHFEKWSQGFSDATGGKSKGNLRAMHKNVSAGKFTEIVFNDDAKEIHGVAKVVDDNEWQKVLEGVYTGFSIGGKYASRAPDAVEKGKTRYVALPGEVSLVDTPCLPIATFEFVKADGASMQKNFVPWQPDNNTLSVRARELAKAAGDETAWPDHIGAAREDLIAKRFAASSAEEGAAQENPATGAGGAGGEAAGEGAAADVAAAAAAAADVAKRDEGPSAAELGVTQEWKAPDGQVFLTKADAMRHASSLSRNPVADALARADAVMKGTVVAGDYGDVAYADTGLLKDAKPRFPIDCPLNVRASWAHFCKGAGDMGYAEAELTKIATAIATAWVDIVNPNGPPSVEQMDAVADVGLFTDALAVLGKRAYLNTRDGGGNGSYTGSMAEACSPWSHQGTGLNFVHQIASLVSDAVRASNQAAQLDGEDSPIAAQSRDMLAATATLLAEATHGEVARILDEVEAFDGDPDAEGMEEFADMEDAQKLAADIVDLVKADDVLLDAMDEIAEQREAGYLVKFQECVGALPADRSDDAADTLDLVGGGLSKMADAAAPAFLSRGLLAIAKMSDHVASFSDLVAGLRESGLAKGTDPLLVANDIVETLGQIVIAMAHDEVAEIHGEIDVTKLDAADQYGKAAGELFELVKADTETLEKVGARNSKTDKAMIQSIHDYAEKLGAACGVEKAAGGEGEGDLAKADDPVKAENAALKKSVDEAVEGIKKLTDKLAEQDATIKKLSEQPQQGGPVRTDLNKGGGGASGVDQEQLTAYLAKFAKMTPDQQATEVIKMQQLQPQSFTARMAPAG
jgi:hypothetical protein